MIILFFVSAAILLLLGAPVAITVGTASILYILGTGTSPLIIIQRLFVGLDSVSFIAIPMFILAGSIMNRGGLAKRIVRLCANAVGNIHGGLAIVAVITCMFFAAISGSGVATAAAIGAIMIPSMVASGYSKEYAGAVIASASPLGVIIPPSISFIVYGVLANVSITDLYKAGIPAGFIMGFSLMVVSYVIASKRGYRGTFTEPVSSAPVTEKNISNQTFFSKICDSSIWAIMTPVIIVGGVFGDFLQQLNLLLLLYYTPFLLVFLFIKESLLRNCLKYSLVLLLVLQK